MGSLWSTLSSGVTNVTVGLLGVSENLFTAGLFFVMGWLDLLGPLFPTLSWFDPGVAVSAFLGGFVGLELSSLLDTKTKTPHKGLVSNVLSPAFPALLAGFLTPLFCQFFGMSSPYCRFMALGLSVIVWYSRV